MQNLLTIEDGKQIFAVEYLKTEVARGQFLSANQHSDPV
jgi:hypothetical protein